MKQILNSLLMVVMLSIVTGIAYPLFMTGIAQAAFPRQANGSLIKTKNGVVGSALIGQGFSNNRYFQPRPSAVGYNPLPSGGSNLSVASSQLRDTLDARRKLFRKANNILADSAVPPDIISASASGLDPHISPEAAAVQIDRVAASRGVDSVGRLAVAGLIVRHIEEPQWGLFGARRVNVLALNLALDSLERKHD